MTRSVVSAFRIANTQLLRGVIDAYGPTLGSTVSGRAWALKALHPSDPVTDVVGVPDRTAVATTCINYQQSTTITPPPGSVGSWGGEIRVIPDPTVFATCSMRDADSSHAEAWTHFNTALADNVVDAVTAWSRSGLERWRLIYYGVTVYLDAPATASQGSIVAAQYAVRPVLHSASTVGWYDAQEDRLRERILPGHRLCRYQERDCPTYSTLHQMPNAYAGLALDGCYMPLKLDASHAEWHDQSDYVMEISSWQAARSLDTGAETLTIPQASGSNAVGPYAPWAQCYLDSLVSFQGQPHYLPMQSNLGTIALAGLSLDATVRVVYRVGIEAMAQPGTGYAPFMKTAPGFDAVAVDTYFRIARELKDAYPAEYNDFGKLWTVIKSVASKVAPFVLPFMGPAGPIVKGVAGLVGGAIDKAIERKKAKSSAAPGRTMTAAELARSKHAAARLIASRSRVAGGRR